MNDNEQHDFDMTMEWVKLMLGEPVIKINLTDKDIAACIDVAAKEIFKRLTKYNKKHSHMAQKLKEGSLARAKYLSGKFAFASSLRDGKFWDGPENDGWDVMCEGSGEWDSFKESLTEG